jgi:long-chain acyl-CoA synthetase
MLKPEEYLADWPDIEYPNFLALVNGIEEKFRNNTALCFRAGKQKEFSTWTYGQMASEVRRIGRGLLAQGLVKGDRVALWCENRPEWMMVWLGAAAAGLVIVPIDFTLHDNEALNILRMSGPRAFFCSGRKEEFAGSLAKEGLKLDLLVSMDPDKKGPGCFYGFGEGAENQPLPAVSDIRENDPVSIIFTSGTTGVPKGVVLSHKGIISNVSAAIISLTPVEQDVFMSILPMHHTYPTTCTFIAPLSIGCKVVIVEKLVGKVVVDDIRDGGGTFLIAVPLLFDKVKDALAVGLKKQPAPVRALFGLLGKISLAEANKGRIGFGRVMMAPIRKKAGLATVRLTVAGGGALNPKTADFFDSLGFNMVQGYGMSENSPLISVNTPRHRNNVSVGLPVKYTDVKIIDKNDEGIGEIIVKSPSLMLGYYENPEATAEVFNEEGYLLTGDLGYIDDEGFLFIAGRKKNLIVSSGGKNIYPEEIEAHFDGSRVIGEILVLSRKTGGGEQIFAAIYPNYAAFEVDYPGKKLEQDFIYDLVKKEIEKVNRSLTSYKKIEGFRLVDEEFQKNAQQKVKRYLYKNIADE